MTAGGAAGVDAGVAAAGHRAAIAARSAGVAERPARTVEPVAEDFIDIACTRRQRNRSRRPRHARARGAVEKAAQAALRSIIRNARIRAGIQHLSQAWCRRTPNGCCNRIRSGIGRCGAGCRREARQKEPEDDHHPTQCIARAARCDTNHAFHDDRTREDLGEELRNGHDRLHTLPGPVQPAKKATARRKAPPNGRKRSSVQNGSFHACSSIPVIGLYKTETVRRRDSGAAWKTSGFARLEGVVWSSHRRWLESIGNIHRPNLKPCAMKHKSSRSLPADRHT
jgi:hypothetical protein